MSGCGRDVVQKGQGGTSSAQPFLRGAAVAALMSIGFNLPVPANANKQTVMTAREVMETMPGQERTSYIIGLVDGLAYGRFLKDTDKAGRQVETGMKCIFDWFYKDGLGNTRRVEAAFKRYGEHHPTTLLHAIIKKECGE